LSQPASYLVARLGQTVYVRSVGLANMKNAAVLDVFLRSELDQKATIACIDLSQCTGMDSTFMGLLVGYGRIFTGAKGKLVIVNPTSGNLRLLQMLGVTEVLPLATNQHPVELEFVGLTADPQQTPAQRLDLVRQAHQNLVKLNAGNQAKFSAFLTALESDLAKHQHGG